MPMQHDLSEIVDRDQRHSLLGNCGRRQQGPCLSQLIDKQEKLSIRAMPVSCVENVPCIYVHSILIQSSNQAIRFHQSTTSQSSTQVEMTLGTSDNNDRYVVPRPGQGWAVVKEDHERASAIRQTQREAIERAREITRNLGGGEVRVQNRHGSFREGEHVKRK